MSDTDVQHRGDHSVQNGVKRQFLLSVFCICVFLFLPLLAASWAEGTEHVTIYFYSSETNINNFKALKMEFDRYLSEFGAYQFQPFSERETFEQHIKGKNNCLLVLSSWHYSNIYQEYKLTPLLVGSRNKKTSQKSLLVISGSGDMAAIQGGRIASASSETYSKSLLGQMLHDNALLSQLKILTVPKDIDALMSLGFGMAKAALTTDYSLNTLKTLNPALSKKLSILAESEETLLLIVARGEESIEDVQTLANILQEMPATPNGKKNMRMLGLDEWHPLNPSDIAKLEQ